MSDTEERTVVQALTALHGQVVALRFDMDKVARNVVERDRATSGLAFHASRVESAANNLALWMRNNSQQLATQHRAQMGALVEMMTARSPRVLEQDSVEVSIPVGARQLTVRGNARLFAAAAIAVAGWLSAYVHGANHGQQAVIEAIRK